MLDLPLAQNVISAIISHHLVKKVTDTLTFCNTSYFLLTPSNTDAIDDCKRFKARHALDSRIVSECVEFNVPLDKIGHFGDDFYRPDDQTNSVKALKETSWSSRSGLNPTRTIPPCYSNTSLGNRLYAQRKGPNVTNLICLTCKNCSCKCATDCAHCVNIQYSIFNIPS